MFPDKYNPIAQTIGERISDGYYRPGQRLPTTRELCQEFGVSMNTIHRAIRVLRRAGLVRSFPRSGVFATDKLEYTLRERIQSKVYGDMLPPKDELALEFGVPESILNLVLNEIEQDGLILQRKEGIYTGRDGEVRRLSAYLRKIYPDGISRTKLFKENEALYRQPLRRGLLTVLIPEADQKAVEVGKRKRGRKKHAINN